MLADAARRAHVHFDPDSLAMVDGSYLAAADLYLGDTSSQVVEFLVEPRPCVFLDAQGVDWRARADRDFWACGAVVADIAGLLPALAEAKRTHVHYRTAQRRFVAEALGDTGPAAPRRAAEEILRALA